MAQVSPNSPRPPNAAAASGPPRVVRLEVRAGPIRPATHDVSDAGFLIGSVPGCDLRLPGADLPPVICLIARSSSGATLRKLVPTYSILLNGRSVSTSILADGDRMTLGALELIVHAPQILEREQNDSAAAEEAPGTSESAAPLRMKEQRRAIAKDAAGLEQPEEGARRERGELDRRQKALESERQQLATDRLELYERYRHRRDRLAGLHEAINRAAHKVQERKRSLEVEQEQVKARSLELDARAQEEDRLRKELAEQTDALAARKQELQTKSEELTADLEAREEKLASGREELAQDKAQYQADLVRLDRLEATLEVRQQQLNERAQTIDQRFEEMQATSRELEGQAG